MFNTEWCDELCRKNKKIWGRKEALYIYITIYPEGLKDFTQKNKKREYYGLKNR
jgi:hypothetical protein